VRLLPDNLDRYNLPRVIFVEKVIDNLRFHGGGSSRKVFSPSLGSTGHLVLFLWCLGMVILAPLARLPLAAAICMVVLSVVYPRSFFQALRLRRMMFLALLVVPPLLFMGEADPSFIGAGFSHAGMWAAIQISLRFLVIMVAVDVFTNSVDISAIAGVLERFGLQGLGFSFGVALDLVPALRTSLVNAWQSLWMRGGLRKQRWRGLQLLLTTVVANALRQAEAISLAAESRAFSPTSSQTKPVSVKPVDSWLFIGALVVLGGFIFL